MEEFSKPVYNVDVLKVEFPVVAGAPEWSDAEAREWYRAADQAAGRPVHLSQRRSEHFASSSVRSNSRPSRAPASPASSAAAPRGRKALHRFVRGGRPAFDAWLAANGAANLRRINCCLECGDPVGIETAASLTVRYHSGMPITAAQAREARATIAPVALPHAARAAQRRHGRRRPPQARKPAAHRLLQNPRRRQCDGPDAARAAGARRAHCVRRQHGAGCGVLRPPPGRSRHHRLARHRAANQNPRRRTDGRTRDPGALRRLVAHLRDAHATPAWTPPSSTPSTISTSWPATARSRSNCSKTCPISTPS